jgi:hypothetical protein
MKLLVLVPLGIVTNIACLALVQALPTWQSFNSWSSIDSLITGSTSLLAGGLEYGIPYYLTMPGSSGAYIAGVSGPSGCTQFCSHKQNRLDWKYDDIFHIPPARRPAILRK